MSTLTIAVFTLVVLLKQMQTPTAYSECKNDGYGSLYTMWHDYLLIYNETYNETAPFLPVQCYSERYCSGFVTGASSSHSCCYNILDQNDRRSYINGAGAW